MTGANETSEPVEWRENPTDFLYHFGFGVATLDIPAVFGDTKFVCIGGSASRFSNYAKLFAKECGFTCSENLSKSDRYVIYKTGPVCWINHGMGNASLSIMLSEAFKLMTHAGVAKPTFIRLGTSGGVGVAPGTVVISSGVVNAELQEKYVQVVAGQKVEHPTCLDSELQDNLRVLAFEKDIPSIRGKTFCADDFYEGQMRLDGFFGDYTFNDKMQFLKKLKSIGVVNIEMESTCFSSFTNRAGFPAAVVCVILTNRLESDRITLTPEQYLDFEMRPFTLVTAFIRKNLEV